MVNADKIRAHVLSAYLATGKHVFVADVAKEFNTSALGVRNALGHDDFDFDQDSRWAGTSYAGRYVLAPCVEPAKIYLAKVINSIK
jgi:hypothetical protein